MTREAAYRILNRAMVYRTGGISLDDLSDSTTVMNALDDISEMPGNVPKASITKLIFDWVDDILEDEGFPEFND